MLVLFWEVTQSYVKSVYSRGRDTQAWGLPVLTVLTLVVWFPTLSDCGLPVKKFITHLQRDGEELFLS